MSKIYDYWVRSVCGSGGKGISFCWHGVQYWLQLNEIFGVWVLLEMQNGIPVRADFSRYSHFETLKLADETVKEIFQSLEKEDLVVAEANHLQYFWTFLYGSLENVSFLFEGKWYDLEYDGIDPKEAEEEDWEPDTSFRLYLPDSKDSRDYIYFDSVEELLHSHVISASKTVEQVMLEADHMHFT